MATSYNGWPASRNPKTIGVNPDWAPLGQKFPGGVKAGDVETVFTYLVEQLDARVEPLDVDAVKDDWGYVFKVSANSTDLLSCHASATAIDYNATRHPNRRRHTWTPEQRGVIRLILAELEWVVAWLALIEDGGNARRVPDEMHFEIRGTEAQVAKVAARLRGQRPAPDPAPAPVPEEDEPMSVFVTSDPDDPTWWVTDGLTRRALAPGENQTLVDLGLVKPGPDGKPTVKYLGLDALDRIPVAG